MVFTNKIMLNWDDFLMVVLLQMHYFKGGMDVTGNVGRSKNENLKYGLKQKEH